VSERGTVEDPLAGWDPRRRASLERIWQRFRSESARSTASATWRTGGPCLATSADASISTRSFPRSPDWSLVTNEPHDPTGSANRKRSRPAPPG